MHELGIAQEIINIAGTYLPDKSIGVKSIKVKVGKLSNVLIDSLLFGFQALSEETQFEKCKLIVEEIPIRLFCKECNKASYIDGLEFLCPKCSSNNIEIKSGTELQLVEIETVD